MTPYTNFPPYVPGGAKLYFFLATTDIPSPTYQDAAGGDPTTDPILADASNIFPPIFVDPTVTYDVFLTNAAGDLATPMWSLPGYTPPGAGVATFEGRNGVVTLEADDIIGALGYTPADDAGASTSVAGTVQLADDTVTAALTSTTRVPTPGSLGAIVISATQKALIALATALEARQGTVADKAITPATLKTTITDSADITPTADTASRAVAHNQGVKPRLVWGVIRCTAANLNYSIGDEVNIMAGNDAAAGISVFAVDATSVGYVIGTAGIVILDQTTHSNGAAIDASKWKLVIRSQA